MTDYRSRITTVSEAFGLPMVMAWSWRLAAVAALILAGVSTPVPVHAQQASGTLVCSPIANADPRRLECPVSVANPAAVTSATVLVANTGSTIPSQLEDRAPIAEDASWLFLVDRSNPRRASAVRLSGDLIKAVTTNARSNERFAIATLAEDYSLVQPFTSDSVAIAAAADNLTAGGSATELYRNAITAIRALAEQPGERKALVLMSDGKAEDTAFSLDQVVEAAETAGVLIYGVGLPERASDTPDLQPLRVLSERTNAPYITIPARNREVPASYIASFKVPLVGGGRVLTFEAPDPATEYVINFAVEGAGTVRVVATQAAAGAPTTPGATFTKPVQPPQTENSGLRAQFDELQALFYTYWEDETWFWVILGVGVLLLLLLGWLIFGRQSKGDDFDGGTRDGFAGTSSAVDDGFNRAAESVGAAPSASSRFVSKPTDDGGRSTDFAGGPETVTAKIATPSASLQARATERMSDNGHTTYAVFYIEDGDVNREYEVQASTLKIGRHADNDLTLMHSTVHRAHAVVHRTPDGAMVLTDLNTSNGVILNGESVDKSELREGDVIELGETVITVQSIA